MHDVLTVCVGRGALAIGNALFEQDALVGSNGLEETADPLRHADGQPRLLVVNSRRPRQREAAARRAEDAVPWDGPVVEGEWAAGEPCAGVVHELPFWEGSEGLCGFAGFGSGLMGNGCLGVEWWDAAEDCVRRELERSDGIAGVLCCSESDGFAGVTVGLQRFLADESRADRVAFLVMPPQLGDSLQARLTAFSNAFALREVLLASDALAPAPNEQSLWPTVGAALDVVSRPFRRRSCHFAAWTNLVTRDREFKLIDLRSGPDPHCLASLFEWPEPNEALQTQGVLVRADDTPSHPVGCANLQCAGRQAFGLLRRSANYLDARHNPLVSRAAAAHFNLHLDELADAHEDLLQIADAHEDAV